MNEQERWSWLQLAFMPYIGAESFLHLIHKFGTASEALKQPSHAVQDCLLHKSALSAWNTRRDEAKQAAEQALEWEQQEHCRLYLLCDNDFPSMLSEGITPPPLLFVRGNDQLLHKPSIAIVGSRHATPQAMRIATNFGRSLSEQGITVISGMAAGIDTAAHQGALKGSGSTIAVWGTGIDRIYPVSNKQLAYDIAEQGVIVSEFPLNTRPLAGNFPRRNRLIAALSQAVLVVEAALESGSLITARLATEIGREVLAVPGSIDNPHSKGCHKLIKEGAKLTESMEDILQECPQLLSRATVCSPTRHTPPTASIKKEPQSNPIPTPHFADGNNMPLPPNDTHQLILQAMSYDPVHPDSLANRLHMDTANVYATLMELELAGMVASMSGGRYQRIGKENK